GILVLSGLGAAAFSTNVSLEPVAVKGSESLSVRFLSQPMLSEKDGFVEISVDGATTQLLDSNRPVLPIYVRTYQIPFRSSNIQVECSAKDLGSLLLTQEVLPARIAPLSGLVEQTAYEKDPVVYGSAAFYPATWFSYDLGAGRNERGQQVTFVKVVCYPVRYSPLNNQIEYAGGFDILVTYDQPTVPERSSAEDYDMVVIAPEKFAASIAPLVEFKNGKGVMTQFKSVESILEEYDGYDPPEQIKYFIKNEYDVSNISYVLLMGGLKSHLYAKDKDTTSAGWKAWWVPARYVNMPQYEDPGCLSDLYYGCLYNATGDFDSWDSNGDGVYAQWMEGQTAIDTFDMYPEVYVSRIPAVSVREVKAAVKKITTYESTGLAEKSWFNNFVGVGGKTFEYYAGKPDGEYLCDLSYDYAKNAFPELELVSCYSTNRDIGGRTPITKDILKSFNEGAGFVDFEGHGNPYSWNTIWHDGEYPNDWTGGFNIFAYPFLTNGNMLPVVIVGGCHNGMYNVSMIPCLLENKNNHPHFCYGVPAPICYSAGLVTKARGGAIASTGCTGYGMGYEGVPVSLSGELEVNFFYHVGEGTMHLAPAHGQAIQKFLAEEEINQVEAFCITNWALFGDPSLQFGGYSS
ncbi:MAG: C25 family cysteine peptidase, partial [Candidatus Thermoplasmatota archaeon]